MAAGRVPSTDDADLVLFTRQPRVAGNAVRAGILLGVLAALAWALWRLTDAPALPRWTGWIGLGLLSAVLLWMLDRNLRQVGAWLRWHGKPLPAMRLTAAGLDYSAAYTGEFELHVPWGTPMACAYRRGPDNVSLFWCLYAPFTDGLDPLPALISRVWPLDERQLWFERRAFVRNLGVDERSPAQAAALTHLITFGTPIAINPYHLSGDSFDAFDRRLRERTDGACTLRPPRHNIGPTIRPPRLM